MDTKPTTEPAAPPAQTLGAELRGSALLFGFAVAVTAGVAAAAQAAVSLLS